jgi:hypothetical protein
VSQKLTPADWSGAAWFLGCEVEAIQAVAEVEAPRGGYLADGQVTILFERHIFHRHTKGRFAKARPDLSNQKPGGYKGGSAEHERLAAAVGLDRDAALQSASWGRFQVMGFNWRRAGYESLQHFVTGMIQGGEAEHLRAFCCFIRSDAELFQAIRDRDWSTFALLYNGRDYAKHNYHGRMASAYQKLALGDRTA